MIKRIERLTLKLKHAFLRIGLSDNRLSAFVQFLKFCAVGVTNVLVSYSVNVVTLLILRPFGLKWDYVVANTVAFLLSVLWAYYWNNRYVFRALEENRRSVLSTIIRSYAAYGFNGIILNNVLSTMWIRGLGVSKFLSPLLNLPFTIPINFFINKLWTYRD